LNFETVAFATGWHPVLHKISASFLRFFLLFFSVAFIGARCIAARGV